MELRTVCVLGGGGFVGRHLVSELTRRHFRTRVLTRRPQRHREVLVFPGCELVAADVHDRDSLASGFAGCDAVVNLVGILNQRPGTDMRFDGVHAALPEQIAQVCRKQGVQRLLHMSALNAAADAPSEYPRTKAAGEEAVHAAAGGALTVTSFRPSVIFGQGDGCYSRFATLLSLSPLVFPLACAEARMQPVYVEDVVRAMAGTLRDRAAAARRHDLVGPRVYTLREMVEYTAALCGLRRRIIALSDSASRLQARIMERLPGAPFSTDNLLSLSVDSVSDDNALPRLGVDPASVESIVPRYLGNRSRSGFYNTLRTAAGRD